MEDFESAVTFLVERDTEIHDLRELKMPKALPGYSSGNCQKEANAEGGKEVRRDEEEVQQVDNEMMKAIVTAGPIESATARSDAVTVVEERNAERSSGGDVAGVLLQQVDLSWDCSQMEDEFEGDAMDWLMDDETRRQMGRSQQEARLN